MALFQVAQRFCCFPSSSLEVVGLTFDGQPVDRFTLLEVGRHMPGAWFAYRRCQNGLL